MAVLSFLASTLVLAGILMPTATQADAETPTSPKAPIPPAASSSPNTAEWIAAIAEGITAFSVIGVFWQVWYTRRSAKIERTRRFQERYQSEAFARSASRTVGCTAVRDAGDCVDFFQALFNRYNTTDQVLPRVGGGTKASVLDVDMTLSLFEEMGADYRRRQLDKKTLRISFAIPTLQLFTVTWWLICWEREGRLSDQGAKGGPETVYLEFQNMCMRIQKKEKALAKDLKPKESVRALCLPPYTGEAVRDQACWHASRRLSAALSDFVKRTGDRGADVGNALAILATDVESLQPPRSQESAATRGWQVILIPKRIDQRYDAAWRRQWSASEKLRKALERFADYRSLEVAVTHLEQVARELGGGPNRPAALRVS